jgi:FdhD protein
MISIKNNLILPFEVSKLKEGVFSEEADFLAIEEPLEIRLGYWVAHEKIVKNISVTMRTPGNDEELAIGFLFTEGIIRSASDVVSVKAQFFSCAENRENTIQIDMFGSVRPNLKNTERNFYTTSSCGVCGKGSIAAIKTVSAFELSNKATGVSWSSALLMGLPAALHYRQEAFRNTGGMHACALFDEFGEIMLIKEDVGRHNALDKLIGHAIQLNLLPLNRQILLLSGRASFELIQKAAMAGITTVAAIGAPSSLAVSLAEEFNMTLIGFLKQGRFNIYTHPSRIIISTNEN